MATVKRRGRRKKSVSGEALSHVISMRISDRELQQLKQLTRSTAKSISSVLREAMVQRLTDQEESASARRVPTALRSEFPLAQAS